MQKIGTKAYRMQKGEHPAFLHCGGTNKYVLCTALTRYLHKSLSEKIYSHTIQNGLSSKVRRIPNFFYDETFVNYQYILLNVDSS